MTSNGAAARFAGVCNIEHANPGLSPDDQHV
jgi:hypothetical protein